MEIAGKPLTLERLTALLLLAFAACSSPQGPPYAARDAAETFELHPDFAIELFAAEPDIADPVALERRARL